jgi:acetyltransferase-like isoleucine patch superfamily enzyme
MTFARTTIRLATKIYERLRVEFHTRVGRFLLKIQGVQFGPRLRLYGLPLVTASPTSSIVLGEGVVLCSDSRRTALGVNHPVVLRAEKGATLSIGSHTGISGGSIYAQTHVEIGSHCLFGANTLIADTDFHSIYPHNRAYSNEHIASAKVTIGRNVFLGAGTIVLKGVAIGDNSVIGAGSVVTKSIPADCIAAGNPCRVIRPLQSAPETGGFRSGEQSA